MRGGGAEDQDGVLADPPVGRDLVGRRAVLRLEVVARGVGRGEAGGGAGAPGSPSAARRFKPHSKSVQRAGS